MKRILFTAGIIASVYFVSAQPGSGGPFSSQPAPPPPSSNNLGGGGPNPDDIDPPPDPIDTPIDAGIIFLLILGTAYGVTKMGNRSKSYLTKTG